MAESQADFVWPLRGRRTAADEVADLGEVWAVAIPGMREVDALGRKEAA